MNWNDAIDFPEENHRRRLHSKKDNPRAKSYKKASASQTTAMLLRPDGIMMKDAQKWKDLEAKKKEPVLAWLLSFPNSGTTYTQQVFHALSNATSVGNYGRGCKLSKKTGAVIPIHEGEDNGPYIFWPDWNIPSKYVLTKTHCGGFCFECGAKDYIENDRSFLFKCASGVWIGTDQETGKEIAKNVAYSPSKIRKIIHLIRDPFDNLVARTRFIHYYRKDEEWSARYPKTRMGFRQYCQDYQGAEYFEEERKNRFLEKTILDLAEQIPCGIDFYRYVQWHNYVFQLSHALQSNDVPILVIRYEQYTTEYNKTVGRIKDFLETPDFKKPVRMPVFYTGHSYHSYFTRAEMRAAIALMQEVATPVTWDYINGYMEAALKGAIDFIE